MQLTGVPQVVAPLATGHPLGLPGAPVRTAEETKVQPVKESSTTGTDHSADHAAEGQPPAGFWRSLTGLPDPANHVAPPSIMQIRISALLEEQAEALLKELRDKALARMAAEAPRQPTPDPLMQGAPVQSESALSVSAQNVFAMSEPETEAASGPFRAKGSKAAYPDAAHFAAQVQAAPVQAAPVQTAPQDTDISDVAPSRPARPADAASGFDTAAALPPRSVGAAAETAAGGPSETGLQDIGNPRGGGAPDGLPTAGATPQPRPAGDPWQDDRPAASTPAFALAARAYGTDSASYTPSPGPGSAG
ncbi:hypothetical protein [Alloyangia pacifica]|uniref:hypothetical protein n=1 Tax=Alloyangia pacifica TaxID=311180 RepID=UPI001CFDF668|nr:hypothetical protein [Alloyangia pacifica]